MDEGQCSLWAVIIPIDTKQTAEEHLSALELTAQGGYWRVKLRAAQETMTSRSWWHNAIQLAENGFLITKGCQMSDVVVTAMWKRSAAHSRETHFVMMSCFTWTQLMPLCRRWWWFLKESTNLLYQQHQNWTFMSQCNVALSSRRHQPRLQHYQD